MSVDWVQVWAALRVIIFVVFALLIIVMGVAFTLGDVIEERRAKRARERWIGRR